MRFMKKLGNWFKRKKFDIVDLILIIVFIVAAFYVNKNTYQYDFGLTKDLSLSNPWLVKTDNLGNSYVIDNERLRIVVLDKKGQVSRIISGNAPSGDTFYYPDNIFVDDKGGIYIHDILWNDTGFSLDGECIMYYTPDGKFNKKVYEVNYDNFYCDKHRIFGMIEYDENVYFITADEKGFALNSISSSSNGKVSTLAAYPMEDAITFIQDFAVDPASKAVYAVDKRGKVFKAADGTVEQVQDVYQNANPDEKIALYRMAADKGGNVYVTDIASNRLLCFSARNNYQYTKIADGSALWNVAFNNVTGNISFVTDGQIRVLDSSSGKIILEGSKFVKSPEQLEKEIIFDFSMLLAVLAACYIFLRIFSLVISFKYTSNQRTGALVATAVMIVTTIIVSQLMGEFKTTYRNEILNKLEMSAQIVSSTMDVQALRNIKTPRDYMDGDYKQLHSSITTTVNKKYKYSDDMYCSILKCEGNKAYAIAYTDNSIGAYYPLFGAEAEEVQQVYKSGKLLQSAATGETGSYIYVKAPIFDNDHKVVAVVEVGTLADVLTNSVNAMLRKIAVQLLMLILVILFAFSEVFSTFDLRSKYKQKIRKSRQAVPLHIIRFLIFVTFMAFNMATSFLPVYIFKFVGEGIGIPRDLAASIPMSVNLICIGLTSLICARLLENFGFKRVAVISACIAFSGDFTLALAQNYTMIIIGLALNGLGVGFIINSIHIYIASAKWDEGMDSGYGFSIFSAASLSGINCGMMFGATLAENVGKNNVFLASSAMWILVIVIFLFLGSNIKIFTKEKAKNQGHISFKQFILNKNVLCFMAFVQIPYIVMNSFIYYYVPIFADGQGLGENESCILIMLSSLCSVYLSVALTDYLGNKFKHNTIYLSSFLTYLALIMFGVRMSVSMLIVTLIMIGIANSFGATSRMDYFTNSREANAYGQDRTMGIYNFVDNIGESAGPVLLASVISTGFLAGMIKLVAVFTGLNGLFELSRRWNKKNEEITAKM